MLQFCSFLMNSSMPWKPVYSDQTFFSFTMSGQQDYKFHKPDVLSLYIDVTCWSVTVFLEFLIQVGICWHYCWGPLNWCWIGNCLIMGNYRDFQKPCNIVLDLRTQQIPCMEGSELGNFHTRKLLSSRRSNAVLQGFCKGSAKPCRKLDIQHPLSATHVTLNESDASESITWPRFKSLNAHFSVPYLDNAHFSKTNSCFR